MGFIDQNEPEVFYRGKEGASGTDNDLWVGFGVSEDLFPDLVSFGLGEARVEDFGAKGLEILDKLGSEGNFGDE